MVGIVASVVVGTIVVAGAGMTPAAAAVVAVEAEADIAVADRSFAAGLVVGTGWRPGFGRRPRRRGPEKGQSATKKIICEYTVRKW